MRSLSELFGTLEIFRPFVVPPPEQVQGFPYAPHPVTRVDNEDATTFGAYMLHRVALVSDIFDSPSEIKWEQRQDAISALYVRIALLQKLNVRLI